MCKPVLQIRIFICARLLINLKYLCGRRRILREKKKNDKRTLGVCTLPRRKMRKKKQGERMRAISRRIIFKDYSPPRERKLFRSINIAQPANWIKGNPFKGILERIRSQRGPRVEVLRDFFSLARMNRGINRVPPTVDIRNRNRMPMTFAVIY